MSIQPNDPRLTAYAFGELMGDERTRFEAALAQSPQARAELAEIERTIALLRSDAAESGPKLSPPKRERIQQRLMQLPQPPQQAPEPQRVTPSTRKSNANVLLGATTAIAALAAGVSLFLGNTDSTKFEEKAGEINALGGDQSPPAVAAPMPSPTQVIEFERGPAFPKGKGAMARKPSRPADGRSGGRFYSDGDFEGRPGSQHDKFDQHDDNPFVRAATDPRSTFSIDVDTAAYAILRRYLNEGRLPPKGAVRTEELINYFSYSYPEPLAGRPFSVSTEVASAPWAPRHRLLRIGIKGVHVTPKDVPGTNLVFLIDSSGSMMDDSKLPLLKRGFELLVEKLDARDRVSIVAYAGSSGLVLPPTPGNQKATILRALDRIESGGSTNGGEGIQLAYRTAARHFIRGGINRVLLATDGDFNVGITSQTELVELIESKAKTGVFLSVLGFGGGNYNDSMLEKLANRGNGNYSYIDNLAEARKVLVEQATGTLMTIAKDVKIQLQFDPRTVQSFRLIGYENRVLAHRDFDNDEKDAGEIGADHRVTALYEIVPAKGEAGAAELGKIRLRYKQPQGQTSELIEARIQDTGAGIDKSSADFRFAAAVAELALLLRHSPHKGEASFAQVIALASDATKGDPRRAELLALAKRARQLSAQ